MEIYIRDVDDIEFLSNSGAIDAGLSMGHIYKITDYTIDAYGDESHNIHQLILLKKVLLKQFDNKENIGVEQFFRLLGNRSCIADASTLFSAKDSNGLVVTNNEFLLKKCKDNLIQYITIEEYHNQIKVSPTPKTMKSLTESK